MYCNNLYILYLICNPSMIDVKFPSEGCRWHLRKKLAKMSGLMRMASDKLVIIRVYMS